MTAPMRSSASTWRDAVGHDQGGRGRRAHAGPRDRVVDSSPRRWAWAAGGSGADLAKRGVSAARDRARPDRADEGHRRVPAPGHARVPQAGRTDRGARAAIGRCSTSSRSSRSRTAASSRRNGCGRGQGARGALELLAPAHRAARGAPHDQGGHRGFAAQVNPASRAASTGLAGHDRPSGRRSVHTSARAASAGSRCTGRAGRRPASPPNERDDADGARRGRTRRRCSGRPTRSAANRASRPAHPNGRLVRPGRGFGGRERRRGRPAEARRSRSPRPNDG